MIRSTWLLAILAAFVVASFAGCGKSGDSATSEVPASSEEGAAEPGSARANSRPVSRPAEYVPQPSIYVNAVAPIERPIVVVHTSAGDIKIELEMEKSPQTVLNFLNNYVRKGFYDQTIFHHADAGSFVAAGGFTAELEQKETGTPIYNESNNGLSNVRGTVAMSRDANSAHSATSQFFINVVDNLDLDYQGDDSEAKRGYCVFGQVIEGMEVVDQIAQTPVRQEGDSQKLPVEAVIIQSVEEL